MQHNKRMRFAFFIVCTTLFSLSFYGCSEDKLDVYASGVLDGTILDFTSELNLKGAILTTNPPTVSVASDSIGYFIFSPIEVGEYNLIARKNGYISESVTVSVEENKSSTVVILLERSSAYNDPPEFSDDFSPMNGEQNQAVDLNLTWQASDPNYEDSLIYDVELYESNYEDSWVFEDISDTLLEVEGLRFNTVYFWQVTASDPYISVPSELLSFRTIPLPDNEFMFTRNTTDGDYEIFSSNASGTSLVQLTRNTKDEWQPRLSPLRNKVAYVSHENLEPHIFTMDRDGHNQMKISRRPITGYNNPGRGLAWSPDGDRIIYANYDRLSFIQYDGTLEGVITIAPANRHYRDLDYSPDGTMIVAQTVGVNANDNEIYLMNADGTNPIVLVSNLEGIIEAPSFSIDSKKVIFTRDVSGYSSGTNRQLDSHVFMIDINTMVIEDLSSGKPAGTNDTNPRISPDGSHIIFENSSNVSGSVKSCWTMSITGDNRLELFLNAEMPDWR
jgi:TolB protein